MGCGAACVAYLNCSTYELAVQRLGKDKAERRGYSLRELTAGINVPQASYRPHHAEKVASDRIDRTGTIVFLDKSKRFPYGHYLVRTEAGWMDPWINLRPGADVSKSKAGIRLSLPYAPKWAITDDAKLQEYPRA